MSEIQYKISKYKINRHIKPNEKYYETKKTHTI